MSKYPDISHHHPVTSWSKIKENCPFVISKATEGRTFIDSTLNSFIKNCEAKKIPYWLYTFLVRGNELEQAKFMVKVCKPKVGAYFMGYILDVESRNSAKDVKEALDYINGLGCKTMIYTMYSEYSRYKNVIAARGKNCAWWEARYGLNNGLYNSKYPCHNGVDLHQFTSLGKCPGIKDRIDLNRITGNNGKKKSWFITSLDEKNTTDSKNDKGKKIILKVDGKWGINTTKRAQQYFGTSVDGVISNQLTAYKSICKGIIEAEWSDKKNGGSALVKAMQKWLGITKDGYIGPNLIKALQKKMGTKVDGKLDNPSACIKAFQNWLNKQK